MTASMHQNHKKKQTKDLYSEIQNSANQNSWSATSYVKKHLMPYHLFHRSQTTCSKIGDSSLHWDEIKIAKQKYFGNKTNNNYSEKFENENEAVEAAYNVQPATEFRAVDNISH